MTRSCNAKKIDGEKEKHGTAWLCGGLPDGDKNLDIPGRGKPAAAMTHSGRVRLDKHTKHTRQGYPPPIPYFLNSVVSISRCGTVVKIEGRYLEF